jgi:uridylate kinase
MAQTIVMSLGGSLIAPDDIDVNFLKKFRSLVLHYTKYGNRVILICGGGNTSRHYQQMAKKVDAKVSGPDLDWIGIAATRLNAELVSAIFGQSAKESILGDPTKKVTTNKKIIVGAGWLPGHSSDKDAVQAAKAFGAKTVINLSNITYVYDKDPKKYKNAKPQKSMTWPAFRKIVGNKWVPGAHVPFDPVASRLAQRYKMKLVIMKGNNLLNLEKFLAGKKFIGTVIR